ncbi:MAG: hypothetical protein V4498_08820 [candidate division FCPU426 bacterium]
MNLFSKILALFLLSLMGAGCAFAPRYETLEANLRSGHYPDAVKELASGEKRYGEKARLLYYFDRLWAEHLAGNYAQSNEYAEKANTLIDQLYTKSLSDEALSFLGNDMNQAYEGESFERVMLHVVSMLNYAELGDTDAALVEARRADERLAQYVEKAGKDKVVYQQDALARFISGALYESQGGQQLQDAYLDYKKADEAFGIYMKAYGTARPHLLDRELLKMSTGLGEGEDQSAFEGRFGKTEFVPLKVLQKEKGEVIVLLYEGLAPVKVSESITLPIHLDDGTAQYFQAAFPRFQSRQTSFANAVLNDESGAKEPLELFQDISSIAIQDLKDRVGLITLKAIARATAKFQAARAIQKKAKESGNEAAQVFAFLGTNLYSLISEQADTRSWRTLPSRISIARMALDPGTHTLRLAISQGSMQSSHEFSNVKIEAGKKVFLIHSIY